MLAAEMAALGAPNELEFVTQLVDARSSKDLGTGTDLLVDPLGKGHRRRFFLGKKLGNILNVRFGLFSRAGDADFLAGGMTVASGNEVEMGASGNGFRWLASRRKRDNETAANAGTKVESTGHVWKKRLSRILEDVTGPSSSGRNTSISGSERAYGFPTAGNLTNMTTKIPPARPLSSSGDQLRSGKSLMENHCSGSSLLETTTRVDEEGEHAASRLFGTPNTGMRAKTNPPPRNWYSGASGSGSRNDSAEWSEPRRHSFGFGLKAGFRGRQSYSRECVEGDEVACEILGERHRPEEWVGRRSVAF
jgi:hypothetical protein